MRGELTWGHHRCSNLRALQLRSTTRKGGADSPRYTARRFRTGGGRRSTASESSQRGKWQEEGRTPHVVVSVLDDVDSVLEDVDSVLDEVVDSLLSQKFRKENQGTGKRRTSSKSCSLGRRCSSKRSSIPCCC